MNKPEIKPGSLCYIRDSLFPENNGMFVTALKIAVEGELLDTGVDVLRLRLTTLNEPVWIVEAKPDQSLLLRVFREGASKHYKLERVQRRMFKASLLVPIDNGGLDFTQERALYWELRLAAVQKRIKQLERGRS